MQPVAGGVDRTPRRAARRRLAVLTGLVVGLAVVPGCGSDDDAANEPTAAESWASDLCSSVGDWTTTMKDARSTLSEPRDLSVDEVEATFTEVRTATSTLMTDLGDLGAPDTEAGDEAGKLVSSLSEDLQAQAAVVEDASSDQPQGMGELLARVSSVTGAVAQMISDTQATVTDLGALDGAQELEDAFADTASCQDLTS